MSERNVIINFTLDNYNSYLWIKDSCLSIIKYYSSIIILWPENHLLLKKISKRNHAKIFYSKISFFIGLLEATVFLTNS